MRPWAALLLVALLCWSCGSKPDYSTPEHTFDALVNAIHARDIEAYKACWHPDRYAAEGLGASLPLMPSLWDGLSEMYPKGTQVQNRKDAEENGLSIASFEVMVPNRDGSQSKATISMTQVDGLWKMWHW